ncbi:GGDEF domain-containing protein [Neorhizobium lilium]|uniref:diguanylate cyclase n=1 Tax=Neorhizobium lilium TaxID=2503024 RepID=A0A3S3T0V6_9HYPH|nr:GGDEF domain-containing protein [Neorhizobium lilium]RWX79366.1 GGDEF domain-containing protein [Neorhizobium lilium]
MEASGVMVAAFDHNDKLCFANRAFREAWFIVESEELFWADFMRRNFHAGRGTVIAAADFESWLLSTLARRGKTMHRAFETDLHDGRWLWMTETTHPDGWMLCVAVDITSVKIDERSLRQDRDFAVKASQTDDLTGIPSRRFVMSKLDDLLRDDREEGLGGTIAVLDIDNFKYINDRFGHPVGDAVLKDFAASLQHLIRKTDVLGRVGGEEFVLVLPKTSPQEAEVLVQRMLTEVRRSRPVPQQASFRYTFSAGIASILPGDTAENVYRRADLALYAAKMRGRDQIGLDPSVHQLTRQIP